MHQVSNSSSDIDRSGGAHLDFLLRRFLHHGTYPLTSFCLNPVSFASASTAFSRSSNTPHFCLNPPLRTTTTSLASASSVSPRNGSIPWLLPHIVPQRNDSFTCSAPIRPSADGQLHLLLLDSPALRKNKPNAPASIPPRTDGQLHSLLPDSPPPCKTIFTFFLPPYSTA
jgi:hypothetical protein